MAQEGFQLTLSYKASADLSNYHYRGARLTAADSVTFTGSNGANTARGLGILVNDPPSGDAAQICVMGITRAVVHGACDVSAGDFLTSASDGELAKVTTGGSPFLARSLQAATAKATLTVFVFPAYIGD